VNCPFCKGKGYAEHVVDDGERPWRTYCDSCSSTGDYDTMKLVRACRLGEAKGHADALRRLNYQAPTPELGFDTIASAVVDDVRRQRHEEMLMPGSIELRKAEAEVERLLREREPMLRALGAMSAELQAELAAIR
jgi:hypothetical protein